MRTTICINPESEEETPIYVSYEDLENYEKEECEFDSNEYDNGTGERDWF